MNRSAKLLKPLRLHLAAFCCLSMQAVHSSAADCNRNGIADACDISCTTPNCNPTTCGTSTDCNHNGIPDECELNTIIVQTVAPLQGVEGSLGRSMAADGDVLLAGNNSGGCSPYIFRDRLGQWVQEARLTGSGLGSNDRLGTSVALWGDLAVATCPTRDRVYVYRNVVSDWLEEAAFTPPDLPQASFGTACVAAWNEWILLGVPNISPTPGFAYAYRFTDGQWVNQQKLQLTDGQLHIKFGSAVAMDNGTAVIGSPSDKGASLYGGAAYVYRLDSDWTFEAKLAAPDEAAGAEFGRAVSIRDHLIAVGASGDDDAGAKTGAVYVFRRLQSGWTYEAKLRAPVPLAAQTFGYSVDIRGSTILVGAPCDNTYSTSNRACYQFTWDGTAWAFTRALSNPGSPIYSFGRAVALSDSSLLVGSSYPFNNPVYAHRFTDHDNNGVLDECDCNGNDVLDSTDIAIGTSGDCNRNGAPDECEEPRDCNANGVADFCDLASGAFADCDADGFLDVCDIAGGNSDCDGDMVPDHCELTAGTATDCDANGQLDACDIAGGAPDCDANGLPDDCDLEPHGVRLVDTGGAAGRRFGQFVAIRGERIVIAGTSTNSVVVYRRASASADAWEPEARLEPEPGAEVRSAAMGEGVLTICTATSAHVYAQAGTQWQPAAVLQPWDSAPHENFGEFAVLYGDLLAVGAPMGNDGSQVSGAVYLYRRQPGTPTIWVPLQRLAATDPPGYNRYGQSVSLWGEWLFVGAAQDDDGGVASGSVYVYRRAGDVFVFSEKLTGSDSEPLDFFGNSVAAEDGRLLAGAYLRNRPGTTDAGEVYVFQLSGSQWLETGKLPRPTLPAYHFGYSVLLEGNLAMVGVDRAAGGVAFLYHWDSAAWTLYRSLPGPVPSDGFGSALSLDHGQAVLGAPRDDTQGTDAGCAYVLSWSDHDFDRVPDRCDVCPGTELVGLIAPNGCYVREADFDRDGRVGPLDIEVFAGCASLAGVPVPPGCGDQDLDEDGDVDMTDFALLQRCLTGPGLNTNADCEVRAPAAR